ncbi:hypothetical protein L596_017526 [Steinernema carpocapsae]|uniref:Uncharacterized protein n=1 Tax=Steinernema carpocapsae TaxID=34508 RepID=A0A4U5N2M9_STECR|nr:hypothetical protein L596_017526 [Steinernema carpocapsae]
MDYCHLEDPDKLAYGFIPYEDNFLAVEWPGKAEDEHVEATMNIFRAGKHERNHRQKYFKQSLKCSPFLHDNFDYWIDRFNRKSYLGLCYGIGDWYITTDLEVHDKNKEFYGIPDDGHKALLMTFYSSDPDTPDYDYITYFSDGKYFLKRWRRFLEDPCLLGQGKKGYFGLGLFFNTTTKPDYSHPLTVDAGLPPRLRPKSTTTTTSSTSTSTTTTTTSTTTSTTTTTTTSTTTSTTTTTTKPSTSTTTTTTSTTTSITTTTTKPSTAKPTTKTLSKSSRASPISAKATSTKKGENQRTAFPTDDAVTATAIPSIKKKPSTFVPSRASTTSTKNSEEHPETDFTTNLTKSAATIKMNPVVQPPPDEPIPDIPPQPIVKEEEPEEVMENSSFRARVVMVFVCFLLY